MTKAQALAILIGDLDKALKNCKSKWNGHKPDGYEEQLKKTQEALTLYMEMLNKKGDNYAYYYWGDKC